MTWRDRARPIIARVISKNAGKTEKEVRKALRAAYPWGERAMHPYKIWCSEVNRQLNPVTASGQLKAVSEHVASSPGQKTFLEDES